MRELLCTRQFKKDFKCIKEQGKDLDELKKVVAWLTAGEVLGERHKDRLLPGKYFETRYCYIGLDWLLLYRTSGTERQPQIVRHLAEEYAAEKDIKLTGREQASALELMAEAYASARAFPGYVDRLKPRLYLLRTRSRAELFKK